MSRMNLGEYDKYRVYSTTEDARRKRKPLGAAQPGVPTADPPVFTRMADKEGARPAPMGPPAPTTQTQAPAPTPAAAATTGVDPQSKARALRAQYEREQQDFIRRKRGGEIGYKSAEDFAGRDRLAGLRSEFSTFERAAQAPQRVLTPEENARNTQRIGSQATEIVGRQLEEARRSGNTAAIPELESRLDRLMKENSGLSREEAQQAALKMVGLAGMGGAIAAGQDVQEGLRRVTPDFMERGRRYTEGQARIAATDRERAAQALSDADKMEETRMAGEDFASDMQSGQRDLARAGIRAGIADLNRQATGEPTPAQALKNRETEARIKWLEAQTNKGIQDINNPNSPENIARNVAEVEGRGKLLEATEKSLQIPELEVAASEAVRQLGDAFSNVGSGRLVGSATGGVGGFYGAAQALGSYVDQLSKLPPEQAKLRASRLIAQLPSDMRVPMRGGHSIFSYLISQGNVGGIPAPEADALAADLNKIIARLRAIAGQ